MKKFLCLFGIVVFVAGISFAQTYTYPNRTIRDTSGVELNLDSSGNIGTSDVSVSATAKVLAVSCSSNTATSIIAANATRASIVIKNQGDYDVYLATYAATSTANLIRLDPSQSLSDGTSSYTGAWYGLTEAGQSAQTVGVVEKTR